MIHEVLEHLDFTAPDEAVSALVDQALGKHGYDPSWGGAISGMVRRVLDAALGDFTLSRIRTEDTLRELEFYLPVARLSPEILEEAFALHGNGPVPERFARALGELGFDPSTGFLKGVIDLVFTWKGRFYLVDWKSNHLGNSPECYGDEALAEAMEKNHYYLQACIYGLALHRYLKKRLRGYEFEKHFGGVFYLFVRGIDAAKGPEYGVYRMPPDQGLIAHLSARLEEAQGEEGGRDRGYAA
jgi:exodeoxyribonuclease V beta subunit